MARWPRDSACSRRTSAIGSPASSVQGDVFPGGGEFVSIGNGGPAIAQGGDVAFTARLAGEETLLSSVYVKNAALDKSFLSHMPAIRNPAGGCSAPAYSPVLNNRGVVVFYGDLSHPPDVFQSLGLFRYSRGKVVAVACPGDPDCREVDTS